MAKLQTVYALLVVLAMFVCVIYSDEPPEEQESPGTFESDMKLTDAQTAIIEEEIAAEQNGVATRKAHADLSKRWPGGVVPYTISSGSSGDTAVIQSAIAHWESLTCLKFPPYNAAAGHTARINFIKDSGCWSWVGRQGDGSQDISIGWGCEYMGTIAHEIGHAIGFWHEQSRPDRDNYVTVHLDNVQPGREHNFNKYGTGTANTYNVPYDVGSLMHYGEKYFSVNGDKTIVAKNSADQSKMGNRAGLTNADVTLAKLMYDCPEFGLCTDTCHYPDDGLCDDGGDGSQYSVCNYGTDCADCGIRPNPQCNDDCYWNGDGECDDGGAGSLYSVCAYGSDCLDCGKRTDIVCETTCAYNDDGECDDGGANSQYSVCTFGTDCMDCGVRVGSAKRSAKRWKKGMEEKKRDKKGQKTR